MDDRIVVGVSGKKPGDAALDWAVDFANGRDSEVELVHVVDDRWAAVTRALSGTRVKDAESELRSRADRASDANPGLRIRATVVEGAPVDALVEHAEGAQLLVVGTHELRRFQGGVFSTRAAHIAALSTVSVAVVPAGRESSGSGVVVGVDGSASSIAALAFGAREADRLGQPLTAVFAWRVPSSWSTGDDEDHGDATDGDRLVLSEAAAGLADDYPDLGVRLELSGEMPVDALLNATIGARLLVVGTHGRRGAARMWLGSVSHDLVLAMPCPVVVIKPAAA